MNIEAGKYYRTRDGRKAYIEHVAENSPFTPKERIKCPCIGYIEGEAAQAFIVGVKTAHFLQTLTSTWWPSGTNRSMYLAG